MAKKNRDEITTQVNAKIVPTVTNAVHKDLLNNDIVNSVVLEKDVITAQSPAGGNITIDYSDKDTATVVTTSNLTVSFTNIENGAVKYLSITKNAGNTVSFSGATDVSDRKAYINSTETVVVYKVSHKNGNIYVESISVDNDLTAQLNGIESDISDNASDIATNASDIADNASDIATNASDIADISGGLKKAIVEIGDWNMRLSGGDITKTIDLPAGITYANVRRVTALIRNDNNTLASNLTGQPYDAGISDVFGGYAGVLSNNKIHLERANGGFFDNTSYDSTSYNRGWVIVEYV